MSQKQLTRAPRRSRNQTKRGNVPVNPGIPQLMNATNAPLAMVLAPRPQRKRQRRTKRKANNANRAPFAMRMREASDCAVKYLSALLDPEHTPLGACVPFGFPQAAQKAKGWCSGRMVVGTDGVGWVLMSASVVSDGTAARYTTVSSAGVSSANFTTFTNTATAPFATLPYTSAQLSAAGTGRAARLISQILKIRYAGKESDRNGTVYMYESPQHNALYTNYSPDFVVNQPQRTNERPRMDGGWHTVLWSGPVLATEVDFGVTEPFDNTGNYAAAVVFGNAGDKYDFEMFTQVEYVGQVQGGEMAEADVDGYGRIMSVIKDSIQGTSLSSLGAPGLFSSGLRALGTSAAQIAGRAVKEAVSTFLMPGSRNVERLLTL